MSLLLHCLTLGEVQVAVYPSNVENWVASLPIEDVGLSPHGRGQDRWRIGPLEILACSAVTVQRRPSYIALGTDQPESWGQSGLATSHALAVYLVVFSQKC